MSANAPRLQEAQEGAYGARAKRSQRGDVGVELGRVGLDRGRCSRLEGFDQLVFARHSRLIVLLELLQHSAQRDALRRSRR